MSTNGGQDGKIRRPLLARGERLTTKAGRAGGGRDKFHPLSLADSHALLAPQAKQLRTDVANIPSKLRGKHIVIEATLHPNYLADSYMPDDLLRSTDLYLVGTRLSHATLRTQKKEMENQPTKRLLLAGEPKSIENFATLAASPPSFAPREWEGLREFSELCLSPPTRIVVRPPNLADGEVITWESVLSPIGRTESEIRAWSAEIFKKWVALISELGGDVATQYRRRVGDLTFVPIALHGEALDRAAQFNLLRALRPMPRVRTFLAPILRAAKKRLPMPMATEPLAKAPDIGIFDGGVDATSPYFAPFVTTVDLTTEPPNQDFVEHGTLVTSAVLYGHVNPKRLLPQPILPIRHYRVLPVASSTGIVDTDLYQLLDRIVEATKRDNLRIINISLGPDQCIPDLEPNRWTMTLDSLAHDHNVTIVCAAGNNGNEDAETGCDRIQIPADIVNGLGIGACTSSDRSRPPKRAPYSPRGPGREGQRVQPIVVAFGGTDSEPFRGIDANGRIITSSGTSFSTPLVTRALGDLYRSLDDARHLPSVARIFTVHFAERGRRRRPTAELGYGHAPAHFGNIWDCPPNTCTVMYEQELHREDGILAMRFPFPEDLHPDTPVCAEWTMAFTTDVDPKDSVSYTRKGLETFFRPHERMFTISKDENSEILHADRDHDRITRLLEDGWTRSGEPRAAGRWRRRSEATQRNSGKWETLIRGRYDGDARDFFQPRLDVSYLRREGGVIVSHTEVPPVHVVMLLTLTLPESLSLYDRVRTQYDVLVPLIEIQIPIAA